MVARRYKPTSSRAYARIAAMKKDSNKVKTADLASLEKETGFAQKLIVRLNELRKREFLQLTLEEAGQLLFLETTGGRLLEFWMREIENLALQINELETRAQPFTLIDYSPDEEIEALERNRKEIINSPAFQQLFMLAPFLSAFPPTEDKPTSPQSQSEA